MNNEEMLKKYVKTAVGEYYKLWDFFKVFNSEEFWPGVQKLKKGGKYDVETAGKKFLNFALYLEGKGNVPPSKSGLFGRGKSVNSLYGKLQDIDIAEDGLYEQIQTVKDKLITKFEDAVPDWFEMACYYDKVVREFNFYKANKSDLFINLYKEFGEAYCQERGINPNVFDTMISNMKKYKNDVVTDVGFNLHERLKSDFQYYSLYLKGFLATIIRLPNNCLAQDYQVAQHIDLNLQNGWLLCFDCNFVSLPRGCNSAIFDNVEYALGHLSNEIKSGCGNNQLSGPAKDFYNKSIGPQKVMSDNWKLISALCDCFLKADSMAPAEAPTGFAKAWYNIVYYFLVHSSFLFGKGYARVLFDVYGDILEEMCLKIGRGVYSPEHFLLNNDFVSSYDLSSIKKYDLRPSNSSRNFPEISEELEEALREDILVLLQKVMLSTGNYEESIYGPYYIYAKTQAKLISMTLGVGFSKEQYQLADIPKSLKLAAEGDKYDVEDAKYVYDTLVGILSEYTNFLDIKKPATSNLIFVIETIIKEYNKYISEKAGEKDFLVTEFSFRSKFENLKESLSKFFLEMQEFVGAGSFLASIERESILYCSQQLKDEGCYRGFDFYQCSKMDIFKNIKCIITQELVHFLLLSTGEKSLNPEIVPFIEQVFGELIYDADANNEISRMEIRWDSDKRERIKGTICSLMVLRVLDPYGVKVGREKLFSLAYLDILEDYKNAFISYQNGGKKYDSQKVTYTFAYITRFFEATLAEEIPEFDVFKKEMKKAFKIRGEKALNVALAKLNSLTGLKRAKQEVINKYEEVKTSMAANCNGVNLNMNLSPSMLFLGPPGTGKTTVGKLVAEIFYQLGILKTNKVTRIKRDSNVIGEYIGQTEKKIAEILKQAQGGLLFVDEAYQFFANKDSNDYGRKVIEAIMDAMEEHPDDYMVIMAGYEGDMQRLMEANKGLESRFTTKIHFEDYSNEECFEIFKSMVSDFMPNLKIGVGVKEQFDIAISSERKSENFGNARTVRNIKDKVVNQCATRLRKENLLSGEELCDLYLKPEDFSSINTIETNKGGGIRNQQKLDQALERLNSLYGLETVKKEILKKYNNVKNTMKAREKGIKVKTDLSLSMLFVGPPGTGKSTVGDIVGEIFYELGYLEKNKCKRVTRSDLVGRYVGETEEKTSKILDEYRGGIIFVDEAYQLMSKDGNDFGDKALETIMDRMEADREHCTVIMAGYEQDLKELLKVNAGLESRLKTIIHFENYDDDTCYQIFENVITGNMEGLVCASEVKEKFIETLSSLRTNKNFGNVRTVRNIADTVYETAFNRIAENDFEELEVLPEDFSEVKNLSL